ncbi:MAG: biopolymer transporter ExbD [Candidatus Calescibacterium sp.]|jgi:biopolymer transport protein ExbD|nr:biopolymer transporter ExbD [Candidatus Calescibacterium sp.]
MIKRKRELPVSGDVNVIPFIDMLSVIIIFLIMVASFLNLGVIESSMPKAGGESASVAQPEKKKEEKEKLNLTIAITDKGFYIGGAGAILQQRAGEPTIPKVDGKYDFKALNDKLWEIKQRYPDEWDVIILPEDDIDYQTIIKTMDAARERWVEENGKKVKKYLFPNVAIAAGIF